MTEHSKKARHIFCSRLKEARTERRMKQEQVARLLDIPLSAVSAMEHGNRRVEAQELFFLSQLYKKPMEWFFTQHPEVDSHWPQVDSGDPVDNLLIEETIRLLNEAPKERRRSAVRGLKGFLQ